VTHATLLDRLGTALQRPLPGVAAQRRMAPRPRGDWAAGFDSTNARHAAGLLLLFPHISRTQIVLTVRSDLVRHSGQVSLPGGVVEAGETFEQAALREAHEEIALTTAEVRVLGRLTPLDIPVSGFRLHPVVACVDQRPDLRPSDLEVARILEISVDTLLEPATVVSRAMVRGDMRMDVPCFVVEGVVIWGATAMVLAEFLAILGWAGSAHERS
jgi:8-oxo-dGTP pyrophosphatase MutT (NUDIX family)